MERKLVRTIEKLVGFATVLSLVIGLIAVLVALVALINGDYAATGLCLIAAALGSGLFSIAILQR